MNDVWGLKPNDEWALDNVLTGYHVSGFWPGLKPNDECALDNVTLWALNLRPGVVRTLALWVMGNYYKMMDSPHRKPVVRLIAIVAVSYFWGVFVGRLTKKG